MCSDEHYSGVFVAESTSRPTRRIGGVQSLAQASLGRTFRRSGGLEGRIVKEGVRKTVTERQVALDGLLKAIREFRKFTDQPLTLRGGRVRSRCPGAEQGD
jgi:hypothetical protein